jgi:transposase
VIAVAIGMNKFLAVKPLAGIQVIDVTRVGGGWMIVAKGPRRGACPSCGALSGSRHGSYRRSLQDLPAQGAPVTIDLVVTRLKCLAEHCSRRTFSADVPDVMAPRARRTSRVIEIVRLLAHSTGGREAERLLACFGMVVSDDTVIRHLKRQFAPLDTTPPRVVGIDDWSWRKGQSYGTIMVDLERRSVVDVLADRSSSSVAAWLGAHPSIEIISRDRQGLYAEGARIGAPQARQVADRFHLVQNLREMIEKQLGRLERPVRIEGSAAIEVEATRAGMRGLQQAKFGQVRLLYDAGKTATAITQELGLSRKRVDKWIRLKALPERHAMSPTPRSPAFYQSHLSRRWAEGCTVVRRLFVEIQRLGFTGCYTHLARFVASWRREGESAQGKVAAPISLGLLARDPTTGRQISPRTAAILCIKPRTQLTPCQAIAVDELKASSTEFSAMRAYAMRFRGILRSRNSAKLDGWLEDAHHCGIYALQRFARTVQGDLDAVRNAVIEPWSNGQTEGQISRLKTLKRAMCGRAGVELLRARMLPLQPAAFHTM